ncbi:hypothetical protein NDU88_004382 [Pleurodeles waltl]|uniref:Uncharacterized protein n=1 Tax=Pleurodeles waltl TaxID=8319 RepID=A0AAV7TRQ0_PLEWA|nr:hypothetical protein NDU88_004382 [Pleurodeles waltl]
MRIELKIGFQQRERTICGNAWERRGCLRALPLQKGPPRVSPWIRSWVAPVQRRHFKPTVTITSSPRPASATEFVERGGTGLAGSRERLTGPDTD